MRFDYSGEEGEAARVASRIVDAGGFAYWDGRRLTVFKDGRFHLVPPGGAVELDAQGQCTVLPG